jgi:hypothetical protein
MKGQTNEKILKPKLQRRLRTIRLAQSSVSGTACGEGNLAGAAGVA